MGMGQALCTLAVSFSILCAAQGATTPTADEIAAAGDIASKASALIPEVPEFNLGDYVPDKYQKPLIITMSSLTMHRAFQGATPIGPYSYLGLDFGLEVAFIKLPTSVTEAFSSIGGGSAKSSPMTLPAIPFPKLHIDKSLGPYLDIGASGLYYRGTYFGGVSGKLMLNTPEEGPQWAARFTYSATRLDLSQLKVPVFTLKVRDIRLGYVTMQFFTKSYKAEVLAGKRLSFAEPYAGAGVEYHEGYIAVPVVLEFLQKIKTLKTGTSRGSSLTAFTGVSFRMWPAGLKLALEGGYNTAGSHYFGLLLGLAF